MVEPQAERRGRRGEGRREKRRKGEDRSGDEEDERRGAEGIKVVCEKKRLGGGRVRDGRGRECNLTNYFEMPQCTPKTFSAGKVSHHSHK